MAVLRVVDRALVVGVTDHQVTLLAETDLATVERQLAEPVEKTRITVTHADGAESALVSTDAVGRKGKLDGSLLSPATWSRLIEALRERTVRR